MQAKSWKDVSSDFNKQLHDITSPVIDGCEHMTAVRLRLFSFIQEIFLKYKDKNIVICSHAGPIIQMSVLFGEKIENSLKNLPNNISLEKDKIFKIMTIDDEIIANMRNFLDKNP